MTETNLSTDDARSDLRLLGGLLCEPSHIRGKLSAGLLEQIGRTQNEGEVRTIPKAPGFRASTGTYYQA